jgi:hypothetical protein
MTFKNFIQKETLSATIDWSMLTEDERKLKLNEALMGGVFKEFFTVNKADKNGFVYIIFPSPIEHYVSVTIGNPIRWTKNLLKL